MKSNQYIAWLEEIDKDNLGDVGGKGANLGEIYRTKIPVPYAFVVKSNAYFDFTRQNQLEKKIRQSLIKN